MNWIQALLILAIVALLVYLLRSRTSARTKAWVKVGGVLFVIAAVYAVLRPDDTTVVANWLGVDRGADLIGYVLIIAFVFTTLSTYMRFKDLELRYARLARAVALQGARVPDDAELHSSPFHRTASVRVCTRHAAHMRHSAHARRLGTLLVAEELHRLGDPVVELHLGCPAENRFCPADIET